MKIDKIIMLVGMMGSGKSSVGRKLSQKLNLPFVDGDVELEKSAGCSINEIFNYYGEEALRDGERKVMKRLLNGNICLLASGGGAYIDSETRKLSKQKAITIWLKADIDTLYDRTKGRSRRPELNGVDLENKLKEYVDERYKIYAEADLTVETVTENVKETVDRVYKELKKYLER